jgi:predicted membrane protein
MPMNKSIKIILAILMLLCLVDMPYGFYQFARFISLVGFSVLAYMAYRQQREIEMIVYIALAVLFQPLFKIALGRDLWNIIDVVVAIGLLISSYIKPKKDE